LVLAKDKDQDVREALAKNKNLCEEAQKLLVHDEQVDVRCALAECPDLTVDIMHSLSKDFNEVQAKLASNSCLSEELQLRLSQHESERVREALATNQNLSKEAIVKLTLEHSDSIKWR